MKDNQKGLSILEILLVIVVIGIVGTVGWLVYVRQNSNSNTNPQTLDSQVDINNNKSSAEEKIPVGSLKYDDNSYAFLYPDNWVLDDTNKNDSIILKSIDYKKDEKVVTEREPYYKISAGYLLEISEIPSDAPNETIQKLTAHIVDEEKTLGGGVHKEIEVDGKKALLVNNKHEDTYLYAIVFHDDKRTHIQLNSKDDSSLETVELFDSILASFKFK